MEYRFLDFFIDFSWNFDFLCFLLTTSSASQRVLTTQRHIWFDPGALAKTRISKNGTKSIWQIAPPGELGWSSDFETWSITLVVVLSRVAHTQTLTLELSNLGFCLESLASFDGFRQLSQNPFVIYKKGITKGFPINHLISTSMSWKSEKNVEHFDFFQCLNIT